MKVKDYMINLQRRLTASWLAAIMLVLLILISPWLMKNIIVRLSLSESETTASDSIELGITKKKLAADIATMDRKLKAKMPKTHYLVINTSSNEFTLYRGNTMIKRDKCSTGSYVLLKNGDQQQWMFKTPKGEFRIKGKTTSPVWKKPDWAFVEEGLPIPSMNHPSRFEYGVLGDYALSLGDGYLIHGTLYQRFLGLPVTHGCIRLNDENLELVYNSLDYGSKVYIY